MIRKANKAALGKRFYNFRDSELVRYIQHFPVYPVLMVDCCYTSQLCSMDVTHISGRCIPMSGAWSRKTNKSKNYCDVFDGYASSNEDREHKKITTAFCSGIAIESAILCTMPRIDFSATIKTNRSSQSFRPIFSVRFLRCKVRLLQ